MLEKKDLILEFQIRILLNILYYNNNQIVICTEENHFIFGNISHM